MKAHPIFLASIVAAHAALAQQAAPTLNNPTAPPNPVVAPSRANTMSPAPPNTRAALQAQRAVAAQQRAIPPSQRVAVPTRGGQLLIDPRFMRPTSGATRRFNNPAPFAPPVPIPPNINPVPPAGRIVPAQPGVIPPGSAGIGVGGPAGQTETGSGSGANQGVAPTAVPGVPNGLSSPATTAPGVTAPGTGISGSVPFGVTPPRAISPATANGLGVTAPGAGIQGTPTGVETFNFEAPTSVAPGVTAPGTGTTNFIAVPQP